MIYVSGTFDFILVGISRVWLLLMAHVIELDLAVGASVLSTQGSRLAEFIDRLLEKILWQDLKFSRYVHVHFGGHQQSLAIIDRACDRIWTSQLLQVCKVRMVRIHKSSIDRLLGLL